MGGIPQPDNLQALQNWRRNIDRTINSTGARTLEAASISGGTLRVVHGGGITIGDGGTLKLLKGSNLILGKGKIAGSALKEQFEPAPVRLPPEAKQITATAQWQTVRTTSLTAPAWANLGVLTVFYAAYTESDYRDPGGARLLVDGSLLWEAGSTAAYRKTPPNVVDTASGSGSVNIPLTPQKRGLTIEIQWANQRKTESRNITTDLSGLVIWSRQQ